MSVAPESARPRGARTGGWLRRAVRGGVKPAELPYYVILIALTLFALGPLVILVMNSLKTPLEGSINPLGLPQHITWSNYQTAWQQGHFSTTLVNSAILVTGTVLLVWVIAGCAAYTLSRLRLPGSSVVMLYLLSSVAIPLQVFLIPLFFLWSNLGLYDTLIGLIIIYAAVNAPFATLLLRSFMVGIPREFDEAARMDGANALQVLVCIILPMSWPGFLTIGLTTTLAVWNEFIFATTFIQSDNLLPVQTSLFAFHQQFSRNWSLTDAVAVIAIVPMIALFMIFQRRFVAGFAGGGLKG